MLELLHRFKDINRCKKVIIAIFLVIILLYILFKVFFMVVDVKSNSMNDTLNDGYKLLTTKVLNEINREDIVVFNSHEDNKVMIKRVIGLPNETVKIENGKVYIDGVKLEEGYLSNEITDGNLEIKIPEDCYFLLGDNRSSSNDSRYWSIKTVKRRDIVSKVIMILYPFNKISLIYGK